MDVVAQEIKCSHCGAPVEFKPGEIVATCKFCGFTTVIETGQAFTFEHSLILNKFDLAGIDQPIRDWMSGGFLKPGDLAKNSKMVEESLVTCLSGSCLSTQKVLTKEYSNALLQR